MNYMTDFDVLLGQNSTNRHEEFTFTIGTSADLLPPAQTEAPRDTPQPGTPMYQSLGGIVRLLHDSLRELGYDRSLSHTAAQIGGAQDRLAYVATLTEQAANKVLNAFDIGVSEQEVLSRRAEDMNTQWNRLEDSDFNLDKFRTLAPEFKQFVAMVTQATESEKARLLEIMIAQDFQDITGGLIKKILIIIRAVEAELAQLLHDNAPPALKTTVTVADNRPEILMHGPSLPTVAIEQDGVDDLLDSLGF